MKHIKKHPINDKAQKLSKDMKKQELVKPKTDKKLDADKSLSDPDVSMRVSKPSNKKLDGEKFLSEGLKHLKGFNEMLDPMGKWTPEEDDKKPVSKQVPPTYKFHKNKIHIPIEYSGVLMELGLFGAEGGGMADPNDIISLYNEIVDSDYVRRESRYFYLAIPLVSYSEYGTEGKFYNEENDEIPTNVILDELNYAIGLDGEKREFGE
jgi:hypothetical protein